MEIDFLLLGGVAVIDRRHKYGIMIDTETTNGLDDPLFYDVGWQVIDSHGEKFVERSFVNSDVFLYKKDLMQSAYYHEKLPRYWKDIWDKKRKVASLHEIHKQFMEDVAIFDCQFICAHNARFDNKSLNGTQRYVTQSKYRWFVPYGLEWWDTMKMAEDVICKMPTYRKFCEEHGYTYGNGRLRKTAEILFQFISKDADFIESHTGLEDVDIERQILAYCVRQHKPMRKTLYAPQKYHTVKDKKIWEGLDKSPSP